MEPDLDTVLQASLALLSSFIEPDEDLLVAYLTSAGRLEEFEQSTSDFETALTYALRPAHEDYALVFQPDSVEKARAYYAPMWERGGMAILPQRGQRQVRVAAALTENITTDREAKNAFPGGFADAAPHLVPGRYWVAWKFLTPGTPGGLQYNGLVLVETRFAWFPKPWRPFTG